MSPVDVGHVVVHAPVPLQRRHRIEVAHAVEGAREAAAAGRAQAADRGGQRSVDRRPVVAEDTRHAERELPAQHRRCEHIRGVEKHRVDAGLRGRIQIDIQGRAEPADRELARRRDLAAPADLGVVVDARRLPAGLSRHRREAAELAGHPETDAAFIGRGPVAAEDAAPRPSARRVGNQCPEFSAVAGNAFLVVIATLMSGCLPPPAALKLPRSDLPDQRATLGARRVDAWLQQSRR